MTMDMTIVTPLYLANEMKTIKASEFKARCLALMDEIAESNEPIIITKNGRPVSKMVPYRERPSTLFGPP